MNSLRFLYEAFLPREARFPDEKFWNPKSGEPLQMKRGGPPKGTVGTTAQDWGVHDEPLVSGEVTVPNMDWENPPSQDEIDQAAAGGITVTVNSTDDEGFADITVSGPREAVKKFLFQHGFDPDDEFEMAGV